MSAAKNALFSYYKRVEKRLKYKNMKNKISGTKYIAVTDSGAGGLAVMNKLNKKYPSLNLLYVSDCAAVPYGNKSDEEIKARALSSCRAAVKNGAVALVVACNTMSLIAGEEISGFGLPCFFVRPDEKEIAKQSELCGGKVALFCTAASAKSGAISRLTNICSCFIQPQQTLASQVERALKEDCVFSIKEKLENCVPEITCPTDLKCVFLGCTHYIFLKNAFKKRFSGAKLLDGSERVCLFAKSVIKNFSAVGEEEQLLGGKTRFMGSGAGDMEKAFKMLDKICL